MLATPGETRGKAPKARGKEESEDRDDTSGGESLDVAKGRLKGKEPPGGTLVDSVWGTTPSLDCPDPSMDEGEDEEEEEEEVKGGVLLLLGAGVLP